MPKILQIANYPVARPITGGQRRIVQLGAMLQAAGAEIDFLSLTTNSVAPGSKDIGVPPELADWVWRIPYDAERRLAQVPMLDGWIWHRIASAVEAARPDIVWLEHPFLWPVFQEMIGDLPVIYSSHNVEWQLKQSELRAEGLFDPLFVEILRATELALARAAQLVVCCSAQDAAHFRGVNPQCMVIANGQDIPRVTRPQSLPAAVFADQPGRARGAVLAFVSSKHAPNWYGLRDLVLTPLLAATLASPITLVLVGSICNFVTPAFRDRLDGKIRLVLYPEADEDLKNLVLLNADAILLPITAGGGTNLKTAEALLAGVYLVATRMAFRGFEALTSLERVRIAETADAFLTAMTQIAPRGKDVPPRYEPDPDRTAGSANLDWDGIRERSVPALKGHLERILESAAC